MKNGEAFQLREVCEKCGLNFDDKKDYIKVYSVIVRWRERALEGFSEIDIDEWLEEHESREELWNAYLKMLNAKGIYVLFALREGVKSSYYQPSWLNSIRS